MNAIFDTGLFPSAPALTGYWQAIYLEPIVLSGERITIACAAYTLNEAEVSQCISEQLLNCLYGKKAPQIQNMIKWVVESAKAELNKNGCLSEWVPPFAGVITGKKIKAHDDSLNGLLNQAFRMTASLSQIAMDAEAEDDEAVPSKQDQQWPNSIMDNIRLTNPLLVKHFKQTVPLTNNSKVKYGFMNGSCAINFGLIVPTRLSSTIQIAKAKIFDLQLLKNFYGLMPVTNCSIILGIPRSDDPYVTTNMQSRIMEQIKNIKDQADKDGIKLASVHSAQEAAEQVIKIVEAA